MGQIARKKGKKEEKTFPALARLHQSSYSLKLHVLFIAAGQVCQVPGICVRRSSEKLNWSLIRLYLTVDDSNVIRS